MTKLQFELKALKLYESFYTTESDHNVHTSAKHNDVIVSTKRGWFVSDWQCVPVELVKVTRVESRAIKKINKTGK